MIWVPIAFTIFAVLYAIWATNAMISLYKIDKVITAVINIRSQEGLPEPKQIFLRLHDKIWEIQHYHSPFRLSSWLGFRHWFYEYSPYDDYSNWNDFM